MKAIPEGWMKYKPLGKCVTGTKIIAFKVPLKKEICNKRIPEKDWFTPAILLQKQPGLKTIIDLTNTKRYYDPQEFESNGVTHIKIDVTGGGKLPPSFKIRQFFEAVDEFMEKHTDDPDALIGVHCTHGLNRTGYFICNYMVDRLKISPKDAISRFESARGYAIERKKYTDHIGAISDIERRGSSRKQKASRRKSTEYSSPLSDNYEAEQSVDLRSRTKFSRYSFNRGDTSSDWRSYNERSNRNYGSNDQQRRNYGFTHRNLDNNSVRGAWQSWQNHPNKRIADKQDSSSSSSSSNWRERP